MSDRILLGFYYDFCRIDLFFCEIVLRIITIYQHLLLGLFITFLVIISQKFLIDSKEFVLLPRRSLLGVERFGGRSREPRRAEISPRALDTRCARGAWSAFSGQRRQEGVNRNSLFSQELLEKGADSVPFSGIGKGH